MTRLYNPTIYKPQKNIIMKEESKTLLCLNVMEKEWTRCKDLDSANSNYVAEVDSQGNISRYWVNKKRIKEAEGKKLSEYFGPNNI